MHIVQHLNEVNKGQIGLSTHSIKLINTINLWLDKRNDIKYN